MSELPIGWAEASLLELTGDNGLMVDGDWVESKDQDPNGEVRLIQLADIGDRDFLDKSNRFLTLEKAKELRCTFLRRGDVLIARMPDPLGRACLFPDLDRLSVTVVDVCIWRSSNQSAYEKWLMYILNSPNIRNKIQSLASGTTRQRVSGGNLKKLSLAIPPLNEQRRIVAKLDRLFARSRCAREELARVSGLVPRYKQAVLAAAFRGDLTADWREENADSLIANDFLIEAGIKPSDEANLPSLPNGWCWVLAGNLCSIKSGVALGKKRSPGTELLELPYLRVANVQRGWLDLNEIKTVLVTPKEAEALYLKAGDVLMNEGGDRDKLGRGWVWDGQVDNCIHQNHVFRLRLKTGKVSPRYISYFANEFGQKYFMDQGKQTTNLASISMSKLSKFPLPIAPPEEMDLIFQLIEKLFKTIDLIEQEHQKASQLLDRLEQSTLSKAFRGELVSQDPNDEPAAVLLERIQRDRQAQPKRQAIKSTRKPRAKSK